MWRFVARCGALLRGAEECAQRHGGTEKREEGESCRFGGWVRFALASAWGALAWFGARWRVGHAYPRRLGGTADVVGEGEGRHGTRRMFSLRA